MSAFFFFNDTATTEIYTLSYTTLFRSGGNTGTDPAYNSQAASNLAKIGLKLYLKQLNGSAIYAKILDPANKVPFALTPGWLQDYPYAYTFFFLTAYGTTILAHGNSHYSMVRGTPA